MSSHWDNLSAATDGLITPQDFESAAYRLVAEQCLYYSDQRSRTAYGIVERYEKEMAKVLAPLGITLKVNRVGHYAVAIPLHAKAVPASAAQTLFALVLRGIFESMATAGYRPPRDYRWCRASARLEGLPVGPAGTQRTHHR